MLPRNGTLRTCPACTGRRPASPGGRARGPLIGRTVPVDLDAETKRYREAIHRLLEGRRH